MKLSLSKLSPKRLFSKPRNTVSKSDPSSDSLGSTSSSDTKPTSDLGTPTSVLPDTTHAWFDSSMHKDVVVSRDELKALLTRLGGSTEIAEMLREVDDECTMISLDALITRVGGGGGGGLDSAVAEDDEMKETFEFFDTDQDGKITAEELLGVFTALGDERCSLEDCKRMIAGVDKNGDGFVCFEDFCVMMMEQHR